MVANLGIFFNLRSYPFLVIGLILCTGCEDDPIKKVDVSDQVIEFHSNRMDHDVFKADYSQPAAARQQLYHKYGSFYCDYVEQVLQIGPCASDSTAALLNGFVVYPDIVLLQKEIDEIFSNDYLSHQDVAFEEGLKRWSHFFPDSIVPSVVYMNSGFNYSAFSTDSIIALGLDFFLGTENPIVKQLAPELFPLYIKADMKPEYLVVNGIKNFIWKKCERADFTPSNPDLLTMMMHHGKMMYLTDALLPQVSDSIKMNWSSAEWQWAKENEKSNWKEIGTAEVMFRTDFSENKKWFDFGPFTNARNVPQDSPPQLGIWMGWTFVRAYMKEHPEVTLQELINERDYQKMLKSYRPYI